MQNPTHDEMARGVNVAEQIYSDTAACNCDPAPLLHNAAIYLAGQATAACMASRKVCVAG